MEAKFAKRSKKRPSGLTRDEIASLLAHVKNVKHRTLIALAYGAGLRVSEVVRLKVVDVQLDGLTLHLKQAKGAKDRITVSLEKLLGDLCVLIPVKQGMIMSF
jgi:integrase/recombinase XerD